MEVFTLSIMSWIFFLKLTTILVPIDLNIEFIHYPHRDRTLHASKRFTLFHEFNNFTVLVPFARLSERGEVGEVRGVGGVLEERSCSLVGVVDTYDPRDSPDPIMTHPLVGARVAGLRDM